MKQNRRDKDNKKFRHNNRGFIRITLAKTAEQIVLGADCREIAHPIFRDMDMIENGTHVYPEILN